MSHSPGPSYQVHQYAGMKVGLSKKNGKNYSDDIPIGLVQKKGGRVRQEDVPPLASNFFEILYILNAFSSTLETQIADSLK